MRILALQLSLFGVGVMANCEAGFVSPAALLSPTDDVKSEPSKIVETWSVASNAWKLKCFRAERREKKLMFGAAI